MKTSVYFLLLLLSTWLLALSCERTEDIPAPASLDNTALLFPATRAFDIFQDVSDDEGIYFQHGPVEASLVFIAMMSRPPLVEDGRLVNANEVIWQWMDAPRRDMPITLDMGTRAEGTPEFDAAFWACHTDSLYWVAWAWDQTGLFLTHSSPRGATIVAPVVAPQVELTGYRIVGDSPGDTLLVPGQPVTLALTLANVGNAAAQDIQLTLTTNGSETSTQLDLDDFAAGDTRTVNVALAVPGELSFGDELGIVLDFAFNQCLRAQQVVSLNVNASRVCLYDVRLIQIRYLPSTVFWDPLALPIYWDPDVYYNVFAPADQLLLQSITIQDATDDWPNTPVMADWPDIVPCLDMEIDQNYRIEFWDADIPDPDDYIGAVTLRPLDYIATRDSVVRLINDEVMVDLYLTWE